MFKVEDGTLLGQMRKTAKCKYLELSYGDSYTMVLYESMKGDTSEVTIYETKNLIDFV